MKCNNCHIRTATIHITQIGSDFKKEINLCPQCAQEMGMNNPLIHLSMLLGSMVKETIASIVHAADRA